MLSFKNYIATCFTKAVLLCLAIPFFQISVWSQTDNLSVEESKLIYIAKNRNAPAETRHKAAAELVSRVNDSETAQKTILEILKNPKESKAFQGRIAQTIASSKNTRFLMDLSKKATDQKEDPQFRELALYIIYQADADLGMDTARMLAGDSYEKENLRLTAFSYLRQKPNDPLNQETAALVLKNKSQTDVLRKTALKLLETSGNKSLLTETLEGIIRNKEDSFTFRKMALEKCNELRFSTLEEILVTILSDPEEATEMRQFALDLLSKNEGDMTRFLPELKKLSVSLKKDPLNDALQQLIADIDKKRIQQEELMSEEEQLEKDIAQADEDLKQKPILHFNRTSVISRSSTARSAIQNQKNIS